MVKVFDRIQREITIVSVEHTAGGNGLILTFSTRHPYTLEEWVSILTFAGRTEYGVAVPNNGQTIKELAEEARAERT